MPSSSTNLASEGLGTLLVRVDGGPSIGLGHVMRCLALAQAWRDRGGRVLFAMGDPPAAIRSKLEAEGIALALVPHGAGDSADRGRTVALAREHRASAVVVDGYAFGTAMQRAVRDAGLVTVAIDDNGEAGEYVADFVVNGNVFASDGLYARRSPRAQLLLGARYALLRREFARRPRRTALPVARGRVLLTFGGADTTDLTTRALRGLATLDRALEVVVLVGAGCQRRTSIDRAASELRSVRVLHDPSDVPEHMAWADMAVSTAGSTCLEMAFSGLPAVVVVAAENQRAVAARLTELGVVRSLADSEATPETIAVAVDALLADEPARTRMAASGSALVDGQGASRVVDALREVAR
jgi:UDP-2,4-diacetamido-2,4,6-trideoxy-beta-L-altropyranose hydrolase